jgi:hypothetical protein
MLALTLLALLAPETPRELIARAVAAHGGRDRLLAASASRTTLKGFMYSATAAMPFVNRMTVQAPGRFKSVMEVSAGPRSRVIVHVLDGERASVTIDGKAQPATPAHLAHLRQTLALESAMRLVPLLDDPRYTLSPLGDYNLNGRAVTGVAVAATGRPSLKLYFDRQSALLVAAEHEVEPGVSQHARYSDHRDMGGYIRPGRVAVFRAGKKVMEADLIEARREEKIDPAEFQVP